MDKDDVTAITAEQETKILVINSPTDLFKIQKTAWVTVILLPAEHIKNYPKDEYLHNKQVKILNKCFMAEEMGTGKVTVLSFGTKIKVKTTDLLNP